MTDSGTLDETDDSAATIRTVGCDLTFSVEERAEIVLQIMASATAGSVITDSFSAFTDDSSPPSVREATDPYGSRLQIISSPPGRLAVSYRGQLRAADPETGPEIAPAASDYERQVYLRPSRYCPSDHLIGFAVAQFGTGPDVVARVAAVVNWIRQRIGYVPGSSTVHDSAEDTLLTGMGTCRYFAHLGIALCRATGVPARFVAVYAPGLSPMDFHAVFETFENGRWYVSDATGLAPRSSLVRIVTGRDAADAAFAATTAGSADLQSIEVTATVGAMLPTDDPSRVVRLA